VQVLQRQGHLKKALRLVETVEILAGETDDRLLSVTTELCKFELLAQHDQASGMTLDPNNLHSSPPDVHAHYERALACGLARTGQLDAARAHLERGRRIYEGLDSAPGLLELNRAWDEAVRAGGPSGATGPDSDIATSVDPHPAGELLDDVSMLMMHAGRPELVARHLVAILAGSGSAQSAAAVARKDDGTVEIIASYAHGADPADTPGRLRILPVGAARGRLIELQIRPHHGLEAMSTINAVTLLAASARELERAQAEREQSQTLWPIEELAVEQQRAVVTGRMTEVMALAQKVARTSASILITGESGTGKEIVARAVHDHSARSDRPFVPFNCTAVPRDMLESQLFGHRRGAFTGADRDYPGLIRTARDGTLFLDEIGEMGPDLQPKLLRFLESGEISPLGEPGPLNVDVRIVAATNADLEHLVRTGRFREDLFYRLNVIPLMIPPLRERRDEIPALVHHFVARAAAEFSKGRVRVADETIEYLQLHSWPGNVRQLQNEVRRMVALADSDSVLMPAALAPEIRRARSKGRALGDGEGELTVALSDKLAPTLARIEKEMIREALRATHGRVDAAAKGLGISRKGLYLKRQRLGL
jgi:DNA-binding NtrC family response regulator